MPELPEVETVKNRLKQYVLNKRINKVIVNYSNIIETNLDDFKNNLINQTFLNIHRKGKFIIFELNDYYLVSHLRMEGKYFIKNENSLNKHDHILFYLDDYILSYNDTRKFGKMYLVDKNSLNKTPISKLGQEPMNIEFDYLKNKLNRNIDIKTLLLDQSIIAGLGNIYVDEILFLSGINPKIKGKDLNDFDINSIIINSKEVIENAIKYGGTTIHSFNALGELGSNQDNLLVHTKKICPNCNSIIKKIRVGGRGTYYCPKCQGEYYDN